MAEIARLDAILSGRVDQSFLTGVTQARDAIIQFGKSGEKAASGITKSFKSIAIAAGEVATELFVTLAPMAALGLAFLLVSDTIKQYEKAEKEAAERTAEFNKEIGESSAKLNTDLTKLSALVQVARDHSESLKARTSALQELKKEYPGYLSNLNLENINSQEAAHAIGLLTDALARKAKVQAYSNLLTKASEDLITAQNKPLYDNVTLLDETLALLKNFGNTGGASIDLATAGFKNQASAVATLQGVVDGYSHTLADLTQEQAKADDFVLLNPSKLKKVKAAIEELTPALRKLSFDKFEKDIGVATYGLGTQIQSALDKQPAIPLDVKVDVKPNLDDAKALAANVNQIVADVAQHGAEAIGEGIGNVISGKKNPFAALAQVLGAGIKELGAQLIKLGEVGILAQLAIKQIIINPYLALAAGVALEALGTIVANKGVQLHADGGIFTQPTQWGNHIIGEKGPEALVPLTRMGELGMAGGRQVVVMDTRISGNDLILIQNRAQTAASRSYGSNFNRRN
jgi:hypothetical protein